MEIEFYIKSVHFCLEGRWSRFCEILTFTLFVVSFDQIKPKMKHINWAFILHELGRH